MSSPLRIVLAIVVFELVFPAHVSTARAQQKPLTSDGGARFNGQAVMGFIKAQHAAGKRYEWNVTEPDVHVSGNTAWIAYTNKGSITDASGTINRKWLESAFLEKQAGAWKIVFVRSTRVPAQPGENHAALHALSSILAQ